MRKDERNTIPGGSDGLQTTGRVSKMERADIVIIGNGIAGLTAAVEARRHAPGKRIVMITEQVHPTINTPALKQYATGRLSREQLLAYPAGTERQERIHIMPARVEEIHANSRYVTLADKQTFGYENLLIATGSTPMGLPETTPGRNFDGVLTLHRLQDYLDLRRRIPEVREAVVIGGGVHAIETVMGLLYWGIHVHWLIRGKTFMGRTLDDAASDIVLDGVRRAGASVHLETEAIGVVGRVGAVIGVITNQQQMLPCQLVLMCTGTKPVLTLSKRSTQPIQHEHGILVDDQLRTNVRHIFAAGDVAALPNPQTGKHAPRAQWYSAVLQGRLAGAMLAGREDLAQQQFGIAWHATHVGELSMLTVGNPLLENSAIQTLTDRSQGGYRRLAIEGERLIGYLSLGPSQPDSLAIKRIIEEGHSVRGITRELLKGNFDARQYLSQLNSRTARGIISGKQPAVRIKSQAKDTDTRPGQSGPLTKLPQTTGPMKWEKIAHKNSGTELRHTGPLAMPGISALSNGDKQRDTGDAWLLAGGAGQAQSSQIEAHPFSGNPSPNSYSLAGEEEIDAFSGRLPRPTPSMIWDEEIDPFSGKLPKTDMSRQQDQPIRPNGQRKLLSYAKQNIAQGNTSANKPAHGAKEESSKKPWSHTERNHNERGK